MSYDYEAYEMPDDNEEEEWYNNRSVGLSRTPSKPTLERHLKRDHRGSRVGKLISHFENLQKQPVSGLSSSYGRLGDRRIPTPKNGYSMANIGQRTTSLSSHVSSNGQSQWGSSSAGYNGIAGQTTTPKNIYGGASGRQAVLPCSRLGGTGSQLLSSPSSPYGGYGGSLTTTPKNIYGGASGRQAVLPCSRLGGTGSQLLSSPSSPYGGYGGSLTTAPTNIYGGTSGRQAVLPSNRLGGTGGGLPLSTSSPYGGYNGSLTIAPTNIYGRASGRQAVLPSNRLGGTGGGLPLSPSSNYGGLSGQRSTSRSSYSGGGLAMPRTRSLGTYSSGGNPMVSDRLPSLESLSISNNQYLLAAVEKTLRNVSKMMDQTEDLSRTPSKPTLERHLKRDHRGKHVSQLIDYYEGRGRPQTPPTLQRHLKRDHRGSHVGKLISHFENLQKQPVSSSYGGLGHRRTTTPSNGYSMASTGQRTTSLASLSRSNSQSQWDSLSAGYNGIGGGLEVSQRSGYGLGSNGSGYSTTGGGWTPKPIGPQYDESSQSSGNGHMGHDHQGKHVGQLVAKFQQMGQQAKNGGQEPPPPPPPPLDIGPSPNVNELIAEFEAKNEPQDDDNFDLDNFEWPEMPGPPGPPPPSLASSEGSWSEWDWYKTGLTGA
ncbi:pro-resilin-like [Oppia nitens]|uniref:pro-resilin-like n=1 Tax=Oppia nitens TaxID=1686743 RepID=UPI0023DB8D32|nr:pro-resilin-like [Oppia nitens]